MSFRVTFLLAAVTAAPLLLAQGPPPAMARTQSTAAAQAAPAPERIIGEDGKMYELRNTPFGRMRLAVDAGNTAESAVVRKVGAVLQTPFGPMKVPESPQHPWIEPRPDSTVAYEQGDSIRFERPTPFGIFRWTQMKTELNDMEKAAWERAVAQPAGQTPAGVKGAK